MVQRISSPVFIGRERELERVDQLRSQTRSAGSGATILVSGEAGIGKSRFCAEVANRARADGWLVVSGACDEFGAEGRAFAAIREMVPALEGVLARHAPQELDLPAWKALELTVADAPDGAPGAGRTGSLSQLLSGLFSRLADARPVLVILDDLHWADESTREVFQTLVRGFRSSPCVLIGAYRENEIVRGHPLRPVLAAIERSVRPNKFDLAALSAGDARSLATAVGASLSETSLETMYARSGGNAFFLEELLAGPADPVPRGVRDVILARFDTLSPAAQTVAEGLSLESMMPHAVLGEIAQLSAQQFALALDELSERGLLVVERDEVGFRHALIREVVAGQIGPGSEAILHARAAHAFDALGAARVGEAARHWYLSNDHPNALTSAIRAGQRMFEMGAMPESADHYERALQLWDRVPDPQALTGLSRRALIVPATDSLNAARRHNRTVHLLREVVDGRDATARERALAAVSLASALWLAPGEDRAKQRESGEMFQRAVDLLDDNVPPRDQLSVLAAFARTRIQEWGRIEEADKALATAEALIGEYGLENRTPLYLVTLALSAMASGDVQAVQMMDLALNSASTSERSGPYSTIRITVMKTRLLSELGLDRDCINFGTQLAPLLTEQGFGSTYGYQNESHMTRSLIRIGQWHEALARLRKFAADFGEEMLEYWPDLVWDSWGPLLARMGRSDELVVRLSQSSGHWVPCIRDETADWLMGSWALCHVELARLEQDVAAANHAVGEVIDIVRGHHMAPCGEPVAYAIGLAADVAFRHGRTDTDAAGLASHWIERLESCLLPAPARARMFDLGVFIEQALAERARLVGEDSPEVWEDLAARWRALPRPYHEAYCRYRGAFALLMAPVAAQRKLTRERAAAHLETALAISKELGAIYLEADIERLRQTSGLRSRPASKAPPKPEAHVPENPVLTSRELEVLRLLVAGESNGQIAIRLGISVKTASVHVSNILRKLDADNRVEAAVRATRIGLFDG